MPIKLPENTTTSPIASIEALPVYLVPYWNVLFKCSLQKKRLI